MPAPRDALETRTFAVVEAAAQGYHGPPPREETGDLGFGSLVARESRQRLLNADGSFNVRRVGLPWARSLSLYHDALTTSWPRFLVATLSTFLVLNTAFAVAFLALGGGALTGAIPRGLGGQFARAFFFSVHTLATIGYGNVAPVTLAANVLVTAEAFVGFVVFALAAGLVFARVSRPTAAIVFSRNAVIAPYRGITGFMFRIVNARRSQLIEVHAKVALTRRRVGSADREFHELALERTRVAFFPLTWTIVHPIDEASPLWGVTEAQLIDSDAEFLVLLSGVEETFSQTVHARRSYVPSEVIFGAKFHNIFRHTGGGGVLTVDVSGLDAVER